MWEAMLIDGHDAGLKLYTPKVFGDERGFFSERFKLSFLEEMSLSQVRFVQDNYSRSAQGVLRGLHFQYAEPQSKLVTVTRGRVWDVAVDIRRDSPTFGRWASVELSGDRPQWYWIPAGFAHGFVALSSEGADLWYKVDALYAPQGEGSIRWDDPELNIRWPTELMGAAGPQLSARDLAAEGFSAYKRTPRF